MVKRRSDINPIFDFIRNNPKCKQFACHEECDEGCEAEDNYFDENDNEMGDQPGQEQLPLVQSDADCEEQREDEMQDGEEKHEGEKGAGVF